jgi:hypothetical protein
MVTKHGLSYLQIIKDVRSVRGMGSAALRKNGKVTPHN